MNDTTFAFLCVCFLLRDISTSSAPQVEVNILLLVMVCDETRQMVS